MGQVIVSLPPRQRSAFGVIAEKYQVSESKKMRTKAPVDGTFTR